MPVTDWLTRTDERRPALRFDDRLCRIGALRRRVTGVARRVAALPDERPVLTVDVANRMGAMELLLGIWLGGGVAVLLDSAWPAAVRERAIAGLGAGLGGDVRSAEELPHLRPARLPTVADDDPFLIGFTSGTTGVPCAWRRSHASWTSAFGPARQAFGICPESRVLAPGSIAATLTLFPVLAALDCGAEAALLRRFDARECLDQATRMSATHLFVVPTMARRLAEAADEPLPSVRAVVSAGAKLCPTQREPLARAFPNAEVIEYYGASELGFVSLSRPSDGAPSDSVGRPFPGVEAAVFRDDGVRAPAGETGEVRIRSAGMCDGYVGGGRPGGFRVDADGWATVGDFGHFDAQGFLHLDGRAGEKIITGGINVWPGEVEAAVKAVDDVADAIAFGLPDTEWGEVVCAAVTWRDGRALDRAALRDACAVRLPRTKCPRRFFVLDSVPLTGADKMARAALRESVDRMREIG
ncbi:MAG: AMP-binding protein [Acetobacterales bacterium]